MAVILCAEARQGMMLAADVTDRQGRVLITRGTVLSDAHLRALNIRGIHAVHIKDAEEDAVSPELPPENVGRLRKHLDAYFRFNAQHLAHPFIATLYTQHKLRVARFLAAPEERSAEQVQGASNTSLATAGAEESDQEFPSLDTLIRMTQTVATLPSLYHQLVQIVNDERSSVDDIGRVVSTDTGLTARLLCLVNSPVYGFPSKIDTISRAVTIVGVNGLCQLAMATTVINAFNRALAGKMNIERFWRHSLACAAIGRALAVRRRQPNPETHFVIGMLHDIGQLVLLNHSSRKAAEAFAMCGRDNIALHQAEKALYSFHHGEVGKALLEAWGLPASLAEPVGAHHHPKASSTYFTESACVHVANIMAHVLFAEPVEDSPSAALPLPPFLPAAWEALALSQDVAPPIMQEVLLQVKELGSIFDLRIA